MGRIHPDLFWLNWTDLLILTSTEEFAAQPLLGGNAYERTLAIGRRNFSASGRQPGHDLQVDHAQKDARSQARALVEIFGVRG
jgi:hypothetical protein